jgi:NADH-quinone oxidoreductase subunit G
VALIGEQVDLTYEYEHLGVGTDTLLDVSSGSNKFSKILKRAKNPMIILGSSALARTDGEAILAQARKIAEDNDMILEDWNGFNVLHTAASRVGGLDLGFMPEQDILFDEIDICFLLGADEIDMETLGDAFIVYIGHHGDAGAHRADVVLPGAAYTEKNATYMNLEGRAQRTQLAAFPVGDAKEDWTIIRALSAELKVTLPFNTLAELRLDMIKDTPSLGELDVITEAEWGVFGKKGPMMADTFINSMQNFFMTDPISRASKTMAASTKEKIKNKETRVNYD